jgi:hypothetical protein
MAPVGQRIAAGVPQHVGVRLEGKLRLRPCPLHHAGKARRGEGVSTLRNEYMRGLGLLSALQPPQGQQFVPEDRMGARRALLGPADVERGCPEVHLLPSQVYQFGRPQP